MSKVAVYTEEILAGLDVEHLAVGGLSVFGATMSRPLTAAAAVQMSCTSCGSTTDLSFTEGMYSCKACGATWAGDGSVGGTNLDQPDLYYGRSLLVRTGFNLNADFFPVMDTWLARNTIVDKQNNLRHNKDDIVGHSTECVVVDGAMKPVTSDTPPDAFSIIDTFVIYLSRGSEAKAEEISNVIDGIEKGDWWVSMEAGFDNFDYVIAPMPVSKRATDVDMAKAEFIKRSATTAGLTKFLRQYKNKKGEPGPGVLPDGRLIGRVLRGITFTGKGYVETPANPTSAIYTFDGKPLSGQIPALAEVVSASLVYPQLDPQREMSMEELNQLKADLAKANATIAELTAQNAANKTALDAAVTAKLELEAKNVSELAAVKTEVETVKAELVSSKAELANLADEKRTAELTVKVKEAYKVDDAKALEVVATLKPLSDEAIAANLKIVTELTSKAVAPTAELPVTANLEVVTQPATKPVVKPTNSNTTTAASELKTLFGRLKKATTNK